MTTTLIVLAHPNQRSFNGAWAEASAKACADMGHEVLWSDLGAMEFDGIEARAHYGIAPEAAFDPLKAQEAAAQAGNLPSDVAREIEKVQRADRIVFHFPIWWFAPPAVLKGWCDRVLVQNELHAVEQRFDRGMCRGKSVLFCATTGASAAECGPDGKEGDLQLQLWPLAQTFRYLGMQVLEPVATHGVHGYHEGDDEAALEARLGDVLTGQAALLANWGRHPRMRFNSDDEFDAAGRLKPDAPSHTPFVRHR